jgi:hypothetical protein
MIAGVSSAEELSVNFVSHIDVNDFSAPGITNALVTQGQDFSSHFGGSISNVVVAGNYAYLGQGQDSGDRYHKCLSIRSGEDNYSIMVNILLYLETSKPGQW